MTVEIFPAALSGQCRSGSDENGHGVTHALTLTTHPYIAGVVNSFSASNAALCGRKAGKLSAYGFKACPPGTPITCARCRARADRMVAKGQAAIAVERR